MKRIITVLFGLIGLFAICARSYLAFSTESERSNRPEILIIIIVAAVFMYYLSALKIMMGMIFNKKTKVVEFEILLFTWVMIIVTLGIENTGNLGRLTLNDPFLITWILVFVFVPLFALFEKRFSGTAD